MLQTFKTVFLFKKKLTPDVYEFTFLCKEQDEFSFEPGQYVILIIPKDTDKIKRLYSIFTSDGIRNNFKITVKLILKGIGSEYLINLKQGDSVEFQGPAGVFKVNKNNKYKVFIGTGTGIMPILSMIKTHIKDTKNKFHLLWGLRKKQDIFYFDLLSQMAQNYNNFTFAIYLSREDIQEQSEHIFNGHVNIGIDKLLLNNSIKKENFEFYLCGKTSNVDSLRNYLISKEINTENIKTEKFG